MIKNPANYYDSCSIDAASQLKGTGIVHLMSGDQLHPPMIDDAEMWSKGEHWYKGACEQSRRLAQLAGLQAGEHIVDVGCGVGGPGRLWAHEFDVSVDGINVSEKQLESAAAITRKQHLSDRITYHCADAHSLPFSEASRDAVLSVNMFYHLVDPAQAIRSWANVLKSGGRIAIDDWYATDKTTAGEKDRLQNDWSCQDHWLTADGIRDLVNSYDLRLRACEDYSRVGSGVMAKYFAPVFDRDIRPKIEALSPEWGKDAADTFKDDVCFMIDLYKQGKLTYLQLVSDKK